MATRGRNPVSKAFYGFNTYVRGINWLFKNKKYLFITFLPTALGLLLLMSTWSFFFSHFDQIMGMMMFEEPASWYFLPLYWLAYALTVLGVMGGSLLSSLLMINVVAAPLYDIISAAVERNLKGEVAEISLWRSLLLMGEELKKVLFIMLLTGISLILSALFPPLNIVSMILTAFLVGWEFYDFPLARRGWSFRDRLQMVLTDFWSVMAFGFWMLIPFVQFFLMPMAVAGGTLLCIEGLEEGHLEETNKESV